MKGTPVNIGMLKAHLIVYRCKQYDDAVKAAVADAETYIAQTAGQVDKPAIVLDIDETSLSNWEQIIHNDFGYVPSGACDLRGGSACGQREWELSANAVALEPTLKLFNRTRTLKGKDGSTVEVFFVTGRYEDPFTRTATEWNLRRVGYDGWKRLYLRTDATRGLNVNVYKQQAREDIERQYTIIANIGDQISDLQGGHTLRCFKIPNPFYFIPGDPLPSGETPACLASPPN